MDDIDQDAKDQYYNVGKQIVGTLGFDKETSCLPGADHEALSGNGLPEASAVVGSEGAPEPPVVSGAGAIIALGP